MNAPVIRFEHAPAVPDEFHEFANLFPMLQGDVLDGLREDIRQNGVREPIVFLNGEILDGRNRYMCARDLGIEYPRVEFSGNDPLSFVISHNLHRRHLSESQRASVAAKLANMKQGERTDLQPSANLHKVSLSKAAELLNVSERSVATARKVQEQGAPELVAAVDEGRVSVSAAADIAEAPKEEQAQIVARGEKEILAAAKAIRAEKAAANREARIEKIAEISRGNAELDVSTRYPVIYADPPWRYEHSETISREIENHYPTMTLDEICAMPVAELATDDAILFLWTTAPKLEEGLRVLSEWGFSYRTCAMWDKQKIGMGYYYRIQHEILLVGVRGNMPTPAPGDRPSSVISAPKSHHSAKPDIFREQIEAFYPSLPKIELFCRSPRDGWSVWGNQSGEAA